MGNPFRIKAVLLGGWIGLCLMATNALAQTMAFTYQGRLNVSGSPASGYYDFIFQVFDAASGGANIGGMVPANGVAVSNGLFIAILDFGSTPFTGPARWLDIAVRTNGVGSFTTLYPRTPLSPTPYAIYANNAGTVTNGAIANAQLSANSVAGANIQNSTITAGKIASGQVVKSLNGLTDAVLLAAGANVTLATIGNSLQISAPAGGLVLPYSGSSAGSPAFTVSNSSSGTAVSGLSSGSGGRGIFGFGDYGVYGQADAPGGRGVAGIANSGAPDSIGVYGLAPFAAGVGVYGTGGDYGVRGHAPNNGGRGVLGTSAAMNSIAIRGLHQATGNEGQLGRQDSGVHGYHSSGNYGDVGTADEGVKGLHQTTGNYGQLGTMSEGVFGYGSAGVMGLAKTAASVGVDGRHTSGAKGQLGAGISGIQGAGVHANDGGDAGNWAGIFEGRVDFSNDHGTDEVAAFTRSASAGTIIRFGYLGNPDVGNISVSGTTVSYNAFTGSHYGWTENAIQRGDLVRLTGNNRHSSDDPDSEIIYGIEAITEANDPRCLGAYLSLYQPSKPATRTNPHLIMAVGNGDMWVTDSGNGDLQPGDYLISSAVAGCAMKDDATRFPIGYICARAAEGVQWSAVTADASSVKRKKISVLFESFERHSGSSALAATVKAQQVRIDALESEIKSIGRIKAQLAGLQAMLERSETELLTASLMNRGAK